MLRSRTSTRRFAQVQSLLAQWPMYQSSIKSLCTSRLSGIVAKEETEQVKEEGDVEDFD